MQQFFKPCDLNRPRHALLSAVVAISALAFSPAALRAQSLGRTVEVETQHNSDAVAITRVTLGDAVLQCGVPDGPASQQPVTPVAAGPGWLSQLTIYLLNRTNKTIVYGSIELWFPETGDGRSPQTPSIVVPITFGIMPPAVAFTGSGQPLRQENAALVNLAPGQTMAVAVGPKTFSDIQRNLAARVADPGAITNVVVRRGTFLFSDNMKWNRSYWVPDPQNPGRWLPVADRRFFPGTPVWPPVFAR